MSKAPSKEVVFVSCVGARLDAYPNLQRELEGRGAHLHGVTLDWRDPEVTLEWQAAVIQDKVNALGVSDQAVLVGHSIGAVLAAMEASRRAYGRLVLCSVSTMGDIERAFSASELGQAPEVQLENTYRTTQQLAELKPHLLFGKLKVPEAQRRVLVGTQEFTGEFIIAQAVQATALLDATLEKVAGAGHMLDDFPHYVAATSAAILA